jgi:hypothetical protein
VAEAANHDLAAVWIHRDLVRIVRTDREIGEVLCKGVRDLMGDLRSGGARDAVAGAQLTDVLPVAEHAATGEDEEDLVFTLVEVEGAHGTPRRQPR